MSKNSFRKPQSMGTISYTIWRGNIGGSKESIGACEPRLCHHCIELNLVMFSSVLYCILVQYCTTFE